MIVNNTIYNPTGSRAAIQVAQGANDNIVFNNILFAPQSTGMEIQTVTRPGPRLQLRVVSTPVEPPRRTSRTRLQPPCSSAPRAATCAWSRPPPGGRPRHCEHGGRHGTGDRCAGRGATRRRGDRHRRVRAGRPHAAGNGRHAGGGAGGTQGGGAGGATGSGGSKGTGGHVGGADASSNDAASMPAAVSGGCGCRTGRPGGGLLASILTALALATRARRRSTRAL